MKTCRRCGVELNTEVNWHTSRAIKYDYVCVMCNCRSSMVSRSRYRAKKRGMEHTINESDIHIPKTCPLLDIPLIINSGARHQWDSTPTLDRIDSSKGYVKGNVWVVSSLANQIMSCATPDQVLQVGQRFKEKLESLNDKQLDLLEDP